MYQQKKHLMLLDLDLLEQPYPQAMATDTGSICILGSKGTSTVEKALINF